MPRFIVHLSRTRTVLASIDDHTSIPVEAVDEEEAEEKARVLLDCDKVEWSTNSEPYDLETQEVDDTSVDAVEVVEEE